MPYPVGSNIGTGGSTNLAFPGKSTGETTKSSDFRRRSLAHRSKKKKDKGALGRLYDIMPTPEEWSRGKIQPKKKGRNSAKIKKGKASKMSMITGKGLLPERMPTYESNSDKELQRILKAGGNTTSSVKAARSKPGGSNVGKKRKTSSANQGPFVGLSGGAPKKSYPVTNKKQWKAAKSLAKHAPNPAGIKAAADKVAKRKGWKKQIGGQVSKPHSRARKSEYARTPYEYSMGLLAGKSKFKMPDMGPHHMTMTPNGVPITSPIRYYGYTDGQLVDSGLAQPGQDFLVKGEEVHEKPLTKKELAMRRKKFQKGGYTPQIPYIPPSQYMQDMVPAQLPMGNLPYVHQWRGEGNLPRRERSYLNTFYNIHNPEQGRMSDMKGIRHDIRGTAGLWADARTKYFDSKNPEDRREAEKWWKHLGNVKDAEADKIGSERQAKEMRAYKRRYQAGGHTVPYGVSSYATQFSGPPRTPIAPLSPIATSFGQWQNNSISGQVPKNSGSLYQLGTAGQIQQALKTSPYGVSNVPLGVQPGFTQTKALRKQARQMKRAGDPRLAMGLGMINPKKQKWQDAFTAYQADPTQKIDPALIPGTQQNQDAGYDPYRVHGSDVPVASMAYNLWRGLDVEKEERQGNPYASQSLSRLNRVRYRPNLAPLRRSQNRLYQNIRSGVSSVPGMMANLQNAEANLQAGYRDELYKAAQMNNQYESQAAMAALQQGERERGERIRQTGMQQRHDATSKQHLGQFALDTDALRRQKRPLRQLEMEHDMSLAGINAETPDIHVQRGPDGRLQYYYRNPKTGKFELRNKGI